MAWTAVAMRRSVSYPPTTMPLAARGCSSSRDDSSYDGGRPTSSSSSSSWTTTTMVMVLTLGQGGSVTFGGAYRECNQASFELTSFLVLHDVDAGD